MAAGATCPHDWKVGGCADQLATPCLDRKLSLAGILPKLGLADGGNMAAIHVMAATTANKWESTSMF